MSRASVIPELPKEPIVVIRSSFLSLCGGDHCAAALLNNLVYWHDWCVDRERHDRTAQAADPDHQSAEPGYWFWKTGEDLETDLLRLFSGKKIRAATALLIDKGYVDTRNNPKDPFDRTKQFRLLTDRLRADLEGLSSKGSDQRPAAPNAQPPSVQAGAESDRPSRFSKNAECTESTTYSDPSRVGETAASIREKSRIELAKLPDVLTEITFSEITSSEKTSSSSSQPSSAGSSSPMTIPLPATAHTPASAQAEREQSGVEQAIAQWSIDAHIRRLRTDNTIGPPPLDLQQQWATVIHEHGFTDARQVPDIMTSARARADQAARGDWRAWNFLTLQVQLAAEQYRPAPPPLSAEELAFTAEYIEPEPPSAEQIREQLDTLKQTIRELRADYKSATYNNPYSTRAAGIEEQIRNHEQRLLPLQNMLRELEQPALTSGVCAGA